MSEPDNQLPSMEQELAKYAEMLQSVGGEAAEKYRSEESPLKGDAEFEELTGTVHHLAHAYSGQRSRQRWLRGGVIVGALFCGLLLPGYLFLRGQRDASDTAGIIDRLKWAILSAQGSEGAIPREDLLAAETALGYGGIITLLSSDGSTAKKRVEGPIADDVAALRLEQKAPSELLRGHVKFRRARAEGRYGDALVEALTLVSRNPGSAVAWYDSAKAMECDLEGKRRSPLEMDASIRAYQKALAIGFGSDNPDWEIRARNNLAWLRYERGEFDRAEDVASSLPALMVQADALASASYKKTVIYDTLADIDLARQRPKEAIVHLKAAVNVAASLDEKQTFQKKIAEIESRGRKD